MDASPLPAGTMYGADREQLLYGLPSADAIERARTQRWLTIDHTNYAARGLFSGRADGLQTARCAPRRFAPTLVTTGDSGVAEAQNPEDIAVSAKLYTGAL
jgi:hypothetical protein